MFSALDESELEVVLDAMGEKVTQEGENIIKEGEMGEVLYVVEEGTLDCFKQFVTTINLQTLLARGRCTKVLAFISTW